MSPGTSSRWSTASALTASPRPRWPAALAAFGAAAALLSSAACGPLPDGADAGLTPQAAARAPIINGDDCGSDVLPATVAILVEADLEIFLQVQHIRTVVCTGTLIAPDVVLTAAHCLDADLLAGGFGSARNAFYSISFTPDLEYMTDQGGTLPDYPPDVVPAAAWYAHPDFDIEQLDTSVDGPGEYKDIGLIFLAQAVTAVEPALVITAAEAVQLVEGSSVEIAGWGQQTQTGMWEQPPPGTLGIKQCAASTVNELGVAEMQIGGGPATSRKCHGDSGGPSYLRVQTSHARDQRVVGITSHAYDETDCAKGGVDTRVDVWLDWIEQQLASRCRGAAPSRVWCDVPGIIPPSYYDPPPPPPTTRPRRDEPDDGCNAAGGLPLPLLAAGLLAVIGRFVGSRRSGPTARR